MDSPLFPKQPAHELMMTRVEDVAGTPLHTPWPGRHGYWFALSGPSTSTLPAGTLVLTERGRPLKRLAKRSLEKLAGAFGQ